MGPSSLLLLFTVLLCGLVGSCSAQSCPFFGNNRSPSAQSSLRNCTWYSPNACCKPNEEAAIIDSIPPLYGNDPECIFDVEWLYCLPCDPKQLNYWSDGRFRVCLNLCDRVMKKCGGFRVGGESGQKLGDLYPGGREFCEANNYLVIDNKNDCFNAGPQPLQPALALLLPLLLLCALLLGWDSSCVSSSSSARGSSSSSRMMMMKGSGLLRGKVWLVCVCGLLVVCFAAGPCVATTPKATMDLWAGRISDSLLSMARDQLRTDDMQATYSAQTYQAETHDGSQLVKLLSEGMSTLINSKISVVNQLAAAAEADYQTFKDSPLPEPLTFFDATDPSSFPPLSKDRDFNALVSRNASSVRLAPLVSRTDPEVRRTIYWTRNLQDRMSTNLDNDRSLRWQYFGSAHGLFVSFPGKEAGRNPIGFPNAYDPRVRPWYLEASTGPKDVVIVIDGSGSGYCTDPWLNPRKVRKCRDWRKVNRWALSKRIAGHILDSLSKNDFVAVVVYRRNYNNYWGTTIRATTKRLGCASSYAGLLPATTSHVAELKEALSNERAYGGSDPEAGLQMASNMLAQSVPRARCQSMVVWVGDGDNQDPDARCGRGYYDTDGNYHPPPYCKYNYEDAQSVVRALRSSGTKVFAASSYWWPDTWNLGNDLSCEGGGNEMPVTESFALRTQLSSLYDYMSTSAETGDTVHFTAPYIDADGLGLMITGSKAVFDRSGSSPKLLGVIGVDIVLEDIYNVLVNFKIGDSYAFMINKDEETISHPKLKPLSVLVGDPVFPSIYDLEVVGGKPVAFSTLVNAMKAGGSGTFDAVVPRALPLGEAEEGYRHVDTPMRYFYAAVNGTEFSLALVLTNPEDINHRKTQEPSTVAGSSHYHRFDLYSAADQAALGITTTPDSDPIRPGQVLSMSTSSVKLAPSAFCEANQYLDFAESLSSVSAINANMNAAYNPASRKCAFDPDTVLQPGAVTQSYDSEVIADVKITRSIVQPWKDAGVDDSKVMWRYVGTRSGVFRKLPGSLQLNKQYDPQVRPWFSRAIVNPGKVAVSAPYIDASTFKKVVTVTKAIFEPAAAPATACSSDSQCTSRYCQAGACAGRAEAVMGLDMLYDDFHTRLMGLTDGACSGSAGGSTRCFLVDSAGILVTSPNFLNQPVENIDTYDQIHMSLQVEDVMTSLLHQHGLLESASSSYVDYQGICRDTTWYRRFEFDQRVEESSRNDDQVFIPGFVPRYGHSRMCTKDVTVYTFDEAKFNSSSYAGYVSGTMQGTCQQGDWAMVKVPGTNLFLIVLDQWADRGGQGVLNPPWSSFNIHCHATRRSFAAGGYNALESSCSGNAAEATAPCGALSEWVQEPCTRAAGPQAPRMPTWAPALVLLLVALGLLGA